MARIDYLVGMELAASLLRQAGFTLHHVASQSETCYYEHPFRPGVFVRVSTHVSKLKTLGLSGVAAKITVSKKDMHLTERTVTNRTLYAIGEYFTKVPQPALYDGPKKRRANEASP